MVAGLGRVFRGLRIGLYAAFGVAAAQGVAGLRADPQAFLFACFVAAGLAMLEKPGNAK